MADPDARDDHPPAGLLIELRQVTRAFQVAGEPVMAVRGVDLQVRSGEVLAIVGPSGSGKSTMMNLIGLLDTPTSGQYRLAGVDTQTLSSQEKSRLRNQDIGFVFQQFHLLPALTALQNAQLPLLYRGLSQRASLDSARAALVAVGLEHRLLHRPSELSGGERQRVAIARAMAGQPRLLLADEPTGALDSATGARVLDLLRDVTATHGTALLMITHDMEIARQLPRQVEMRDGRIRCVAQPDRRPLEGAAVDPAQRRASVPA
ncbi:ABC transporter ATP-binding protein [Ralstonia solanacearum]|uniref:ABC transporter ATP-binding protein n=1 Tax=Ralstonia solanacearum TaxID=305 RepID=UPI00078D385A|nr:ABC transporter ATP-binding protein [Ralstonia solanacearum]AMP40287.1 macrolide ABC transporter ATP-binding protein [Ralstonia solanacearum]AXV89145.1 ABC transporter ATP-binding protein [Ralstonia solanacearum]AXW08614.1 ABC transporter ATP-binding protein [Ralstonia solanacearum]AXW26395.1 ABC transporter ATP-binding protein [Ralstonia solanacearum]AXW83313.1 ABC transporter ATP-binding protein [Ralstonia solanacearum]